MRATITVFPSLTKTKGQRTEIDVEQFLSTPRVAVDKRSLPLFSFALFKDDIRDGSTFESIRVLGFDVDVDPVPTQSDIRKRLQDLGLAGWLHSSSSATSTAPRWRLFMPVSRVLTAEEYRILHSQMRRMLEFPVGQQAVDPTRAWFVPAKRIGLTYTFEAISGGDIPVETFLHDASNRPSSAIGNAKYRAPSSPVLGSEPINLPPDDETHEALIAHLVTCWPKVGRRDEAHMALSGTLARLGYGPDYVARVVEDLSEDTGSDKGIARASMVRRTFDKLSSGSPVASWSKLVEIIGLHNAEQIHDILHITLPSASTNRPVSPSDELPDRSDNHVYKYSLGDAPAAELRQYTMSDLVATLTDHPDWRHVLRWNALSDSVVAVNPPLQLDAEEEKFSDVDVTKIRMWLEAHGARASQESVFQAIQAAAKKIEWNPIEVYLKRCAKVKPTGAIEDLCEKALHVTDELSKQMVRKILIAAVRRATVKGGVKVDEMLIFKSNQGLGKTRFIETLFGSKYVKTNLSDITNKESALELKGIWAVEFGELASIANAEVEALKEFSSRAVDKYRPPYGRAKIEQPRTCVFFATTNSETFLKDETGNRRPWVIELFRDIDIEWVRTHRNLVWAEAYHAAQSGEKHWFDKELVQQTEQRANNFLVLDAWAQLVHDYCVGKEWVRVDEIYQMAICGGNIEFAKSLDPKVQKRIERILTIFRATSGVRREHGKVTRAWHLPEEFRSKIRLSGEDGPSAPATNPAAVPAPTVAPKAKLIEMFKRV